MFLVSPEQITNLSLAIRTRDSSVTEGCRGPECPPPLKVFSGKFNLLELSGRETDEKEQKKGMEEKEGKFKEGRTGRKLN